MKRHASLVWSGTGKEGNGKFTTESKSLDGIDFNWKSRFDVGAGTNPEELIAAAHAGCFTMKVSFLVNAINFTAEKLDCTCEITMEAGVISASHLKLVAKVPGISQEQFDKVVNESIENCMVTKVLNLTTTCEAVLEA